jgi:fructose-specific phosphotransferase system IIC component
MVEQSHLAALALAAAPALLLGGLASPLFGWLGGLIVGGIVAGQVFFLVLVATTTSLQGLCMTFLSPLWTLTYRELRALKGLKKEAVKP